MTLTNEQVRNLQALLNERAPGTDLLIDGIFGYASRQALIAFQSRQGLIPDGIYGPKTEAEVKRLSAGGSTKATNRRMRIILVRGKLGAAPFGFSLGMDALAKKLNAIPGVVATVDNYGLFYSMTDDIQVALEGALKGGYQNVGCIGHSMGADTAVKVANLMNGSGKIMALCGPVDPTPFGCPTVPGNVFNTIAYYNTLPAQLGGYAVRKGAGYHGKWKVTPLALPHTWIDDDADTVHASYLQAVKDLVA